MFRGRLLCDLARQKNKISNESIAKISEEKIQIIKEIHLTSRVNDNCATTITINYESRDEEKEECMVPSPTFSPIIPRYKNPSENSILAAESSEPENESDFQDSGSEYIPPSWNSSVESIFQVVVSSEITKKGTMRDKSRTPDVKGRKRIRQVTEWKATKAKIASNAGKGFVNVHGKNVCAKTMGYGCAISCKNKCSEIFDIATRKVNFDKFWSIANKDKKWEFILRFTTAKEKKKKLIDAKYNRSGNRDYFLLNKSNERTKVCRKMFFDTLGINSQWIATAFKKSASNFGILSPDKRGHHQRIESKIKTNSKKIVCEHIESFPLIESHYLRKDSTRKYLDSSLNIARMYRLFLVWAADKSYEHNITERLYRDIFNTEYNISFFIPKKDSCDLCCIYDSKSEEERKPMQEQYNKHLLNKNMARFLKEESKIYANGNPNKTITAVFDFQKVLTIPQGETSIFYYKRKYAVLNFTIFNMVPKQGHCFVWHENIAKRGAIEVTSCLKIFIEGEVKKGCSEFIFWSDNCGGQNRNKFIYSFYAWACQQYKINITHRFLEKGHTQNEGDSMHACIENRKKGREIFVPSQWYEIIRFAKVNPPYYNVVEMSQDLFINIKGLANKLNFAKNTQNEKFMISFVKEVKFDVDSPLIVRYKNNFNDDYKSLQLIKDIKGRGRKSTVCTEIVNQQLPKAYHSMLPISKAKYDDLNYLCKHSHIDQKYHVFYENLTFGCPSIADSDEE